MAAAHMNTRHRQRSFFCVDDHLVSRSCFFFIIFFVVIAIVFLQTHALKKPLVSLSTSSSSPSSSSASWESDASATVGIKDCARKLENATSRLQNMVKFLPLKDLRFAGKPMYGHTWFMSSINDTIEDNMPLYIHFPSNHTNGRVLCLAGNDRSNGTKNSYALAWRDSLPHGAKLLGGLTIVSDTFYGHNNLWHGQSAVLPIVGWYNMKKVEPARFVLYHKGELRSSRGKWVQSVVDIVFGKRIAYETFDDGRTQPRRHPTCFEEAVVLRHNEGGMPKLKRREVYDLIRKSARKHCNISNTSRSPRTVGLTLFLRKGSRSFKNDSAVIEVFKKECDKVGGCKLGVISPDNLSFCDQVKLMSETDVLVTQHGAQLTNLIFMDRNSSVMEFFPKAWLEYAGVGQYVFHWMADWAGMRHEGAWRDEMDEAKDIKEDRCSFPPKESRCFTYYKDRQIGHNQTYLAHWACQVLRRFKPGGGNLPEDSNSGT
ncbi:hypothetical protein ZOSMA_171G00470 [Zostera marina]|uniref:Glycosyltransferase 61 catalytic domain-containing protein n=1 Tax=Zostera marina TaxID=29655 RepID=A0A0K9PUN0_ZOSMR|nr:hypothetical protein ZOSMA_171G00470 [Zostera marina]